MRAVVGLIAGMIAGFVIVPGSDQKTVIGWIILIGLLFYIMSYVIAKRLAGRIAKSERKKVATNGIFPFIFLLLMFMIVVYTGLHQGLAR
jgi:Kef-type K+ transport system membrane component KefB